MSIGVDALGPLALLCEVQWRSHTRSTGRLGARVRRDNVSRSSSDRPAFGSSSVLQRRPSRHVNVRVRQLSERRVKTWGRASEHRSRPRTPSKWVLVDSRGCREVIAIVGKCRA